MWDRLGVLLRKGYRFDYEVGGRFTMIMYFVYLLRFIKYLEVSAIPGIAARISDPHSVITIENDKVVGLDIHSGIGVSGFIKITDGYDGLFVFCKGSEVTKLSNWLVNGGKYAKN